MVLRPFREAFGEEGERAVNASVVAVLTRGTRDERENLKKFFNEKIEGIKHASFSKEDSLNLRIFRGVDFSVSIRPAREGAVEREVKEYESDWSIGRANAKDLAGKVLGFLKSSRYVIVEVMPLVRNFFLSGRPDIMPWEEGPKRIVAFVRYWGQKAEKSDDTGMSVVAVLNEHVSAEDLCAFLNRLTLELQELIARESLYNMVEGGG
jgi:hypothetical protein